MATTPIWVTLITASLGGLLAGLLTLVGVMITQRHARLREDARWQREHEREQDLWAREDDARSYEYRREAYADFIKEFYRRWDDLSEVDGIEGRADDEFPTDNFYPLPAILDQIRIFGTKKAAELAMGAISVLGDGVFLGKQIPDDVLETLLSEIRRDLSISDRANPRTHQ